MLVSRLSLAGRVVVLLLMTSAPLHALGPHEILVLVNDASPRSLEVANHYIALRHVPAENVAHLTLPSSVVAPSASISRDEFTRLIWDPAQAILRNRHLEDHILAWVYSADFPVLISGDPEVSLLGLTFVRNQLPDADAIRSGRYTSPLFAGPGQGSDRKANTRSLEQYAAFLQTNMPLPSMMLGHTGTRGMTVERLVTLLRESAAVDGTMPQGEVVFLVNDDVRSTCRAWEYEGAVAELRALGVPAGISSNAPDRTRRLIGLMMGGAYADAAALGTLVPGSMAEHLTSYAANFSYPDQTKLTAWLRAGASASAGTVTEPFAVWTKFPHARLFAHYVTGCSMLESFFQAVASPLQLQIMGDPLARPWARPPGVTVVDLNDAGKPLQGTAEFLASTWSSPFEPAPVTLFLVDGRSTVTPPDRPQVRIDTTALRDGYHELRAVAYTRGDVRHQGFDLKGFQVRNQDRAVRLAGLATNEALDLFHVRQLAVEADGAPREVGLISQSRTLVRQPYTAGAVVPLDARALGAGPNVLQAAAWYDDGEPVLSGPVPVHIERMNQVPVLDAVERAATSNGWMQLTARARDAEQDAIDITWWQDLALDAAPFSALGGRCALSRGAFQLAATDELVLAISPVTQGQSYSEIAADVHVPRADAAQTGQFVGIVFAYRDPANFSFFGWLGQNSAWILGSYQGGTLRQEVAIGTFLEPDQWYRVRVRQADAHTVEALVDDEVIARSAQGALAGPVGLVAGTATMEARGLAVTPPVLLDPPVRLADGNVFVKGETIPAALQVRAADAVGGRIQRADQ